MISRSAFSAARSLLICGALFISTGLGACGATPRPTEPKALSVSEVDSDAEAAPQPLHEDPLLVRQINGLKVQLASCKLVEKKGPSCDAWKAWQELDWRELESARATLFSLLASTDDAVRFAAVYALASDKASITDATEANQLIAALAEEHNEAVRVPIAKLVGQIDFTQNSKAGTLLLDLMDHAPDSDTRTEMSILARKVPGVVARVLRRFEAAAYAERLSIVVMSMYITVEDNCPIYDRALADDQVAEAALGILAIGFCKPLWDKAIAWIPTAKIDPFNSNVATSIKMLCSQPVSDAQRALLLAQAKRLTKHKSSASLRVDALHAVLACDPENGRSFVRGFTSDPDTSVAVPARELSQPPEQE
ncbi:MAG: HEAT repeat domain-containing protein [Polyangiaceae bacterium]|nr:HEAT repeat domain-containing protein [Polyangiaceae bacterium]